jgi:hypothetical protein
MIRARRFRRVCGIVFRLCRGGGATMYRVLIIIIIILFPHV